MADSTTCAKCNRVVFVTDVDRRGWCLLCQPAEEPPADEAPKAERL